MKDPSLDWFGSASQIEPHDGIGHHAEVDHGVPELLVCLVSLRWDHKLRELRWTLHIGRMSSIVLVEVNALDHELAGLLIIGQIHKKSKLIRLGAEELLHNWSVLLAISCLRIPLIKNSLNLSQIVYLVVAEGLDIFREPSPVHEDTAWLIIFVKMRIEGSDDLNTLFLVFFFFDQYLLVNVHIALKRNWLHVPFLRELGFVLVDPGEVSSILGSDIDWILREG